MGDNLVIVHRLDHRSQARSKFTTCCVGAKFHFTCACECFLRARWRIVSVLWCVWLVCGGSQLACLYDMSLVSLQHDTHCTNDEQRVQLLTTTFIDLNQGVVARASRTPRAY